ncbi:MAG: hypothetical protein K2G55_09100 [Lachnospiraceae bacterium]|nr:hypothetical protein [Lachnospiraceae bacterium]MDE7202785.1 hypothetical protein [Lachnospiraceae bacterium]
MNFEYEKDYIMRVIKEMVRVLFSLLFGKKYVSVEQENENKYEVSGKKLNELKAMVDQGKMNEAENILLDGIDYANKNEVAAAALFYQYLSEQEDDFLKQHNYSKEEVLDGMKQLLKNAGFSDLTSMIE